MDEKVKRYYKHYESQFADIIGLESLESKAKDKKLDWLVDACKRFGYPYSSIWRYENLANMKYLVPLRKTDYICTVLKYLERGLKHNLLQHTLLCIVI